MTAPLAGALSGGPPPLRDRKWRTSYVAGGIRDYAPGFAVEYAIVVVCLLAFQSLGYTALGLSGRIPETSRIPLGLLIALVALGAAEARFRLYRRVWVVAGLSDAMAIGYAVIEATLLITFANALMPDAYRPFRLLVPPLAAPAMAALFASFRLLPRLRSRVATTGSRLLVVINDASSYGAIRSLVQHPNPEWSPIGVVTCSDRAEKVMVMGVPVLGTANDLRHWIQVTNADGVAFVPSGRTMASLQDLVSVCLESELPIFVVPDPDEWLHRPGLARLRLLSADDLVGRERREMDLELVRPLVNDRVVLVSGAAGSIGSELARQLAALQPRRIVLVDNNESGLFDIAEELRVTQMVDVKEALVSIVDRELLLSVFAQERPEIVFHAAAYKHVPMLETHPEQAVLTNVLGTRNMLDCAEAVGATQFVLVSTDKAVAKHSVMGCSKRLCELMVLGHEGVTSCWAVRFGNVVGSRGSVVPIFERQIQQGGPVTVTHPDVTRYLMTIQEAAALVVSTLRLAKPRHVYMLNMGEPVSILALAHALIRARGLRPGADIEIVFTGLRPGERLTEDLMSEDEGSRETSHPDVLEVIAAKAADPAVVEWAVPRLQTLAQEGRGSELIALLKRTVAAGPGDREPDPEAIGKRGPLAGKRQRSEG